MKRLHFNKPNNLSQLHDELLGAILSLAQVTVDADGENVALPENMRVEGRDDEIWLTVPDDADGLAIGAVVQAHDPSLPRFDPAAQRQERVTELLAIGRSNWTAGQRNELLDLVARNS